MNILVTGAAGFIGGYLYKELKKLGHTIIGIDNFINASKYISNDCLKCDIGDTEHINDIIRSNDINLVYSIASRISVDESLIEREEYYNNNVDKFRNFIETIVQYNNKYNKNIRIIHASSSEVYGSNINPGITMKSYHPTNPMSHYALTKYIQEEIIKLYDRLYGLDYTIQRFFNIFGPGQSDLAFIPKAIKSALINEDIVIYGDGTQKRSYTPVDSVVEEYINLMAYKSKTICNFGDPKCHSINSIAEDIINITNSKSKLKYINPRISEVTELLPDCTNYKSNIEFKEYLKKTIEFYKGTRL